jgi:glucose-6-phosphate-specific signal transduction histidine kinase
VGGAVVVSVGVGGAGSAAAAHRGCSANHATPSTTTAQVVVRYHPADLELEISDDGHRAASGDGAGQGLIGMRERVALYGGEFHSGHRTEGGYLVRARLPLPSGPR